MEKLDKKAFIEKVFDFENEKEWKYRGDLPAIVDFYADWCGPCKMVTPILEKLSAEYDGKLAHLQGRHRQGAGAGRGVRHPEHPQPAVHPAEGRAADGPRRPGPRSVRQDRSPMILGVKKDEQTSEE